MRIDLTVLLHIFIKPTQHWFLFLLRDIIGYLMSNFRIHWSQQMTWCIFSIFYGGKYYCGMLLQRQQLSILIHQILGCSHYDLLHPQIRPILGRDSHITLPANPSIQGNGTCCKVTAARCKSPSDWHPQKGIMPQPSLYDWHTSFWYYRSPQYLLTTVP